MKYLISKFPCLMKAEEIFALEPYVKYEILDKSDYVEFFFDGESNLIDFSNCNKNLLSFEFENNQYYFLRQKSPSNSNSVSFKFKNSIISISISNEIKIFVSGKLVLKNHVNNIEYSSYEEVGEYCIIYFVGERSYFAALKNQECVCSDFYDESNLTDNEKYFMCRKYDALNHGKVYHFEGGNFDSYLVYLDECELKLKPRFVSNVFLDCLMVGNLKYCNELLSDELKQEENNIKNFFGDFDDFFELTENTFVLIKKNTLAGIYRFEIKDCGISNIIVLQ